MNASGLSDVLRDLAGGQGGSASRGGDDTPAPPLAKPRDQPSAAASSTARRSTLARPATQDPLRPFATPILIAVGMLLLVPGAWAVGVLAGFEIWRADQPGAERMAIVMLACLPLGLILFGGAWWFSRPRGASGRPRRQ